MLDIFVLFLAKNGLKANRTAPEKLSNGDENEIKVTVQNFYTFPIYIKIIDEIPFQFQIRNFEIRKKIAPSTISASQYFLRPVTRGEYFFGKFDSPHS